VRACQPGRAAGGHLGASDGRVIVLSSMMTAGPFHCADGHEDLLRAVFQHVGDAEYR
jgi:hypothetical protein